MQRHPDLTASEIAELLGTTKASVEYARRTYGRFYTGGDRICVKCDERPVFIESPQARRLHLCKGCWQEEQRRRLEEEPEAVRLRQAKKRRGHIG